MARPFDRKQNVLGTASIYTIAGVVNGSLIFLLMPLFTRYMSTEEYGTVSMFRTTSSFVFPLMAFYASVPRAYFDRDNLDYNRYVANALIVILATTAIASLLLFCAGSLIYEYTQFPVEFLWTVIAFGFGNSVTKLALGILQVQRKAITYGILQIGLTIVNFAVAIILVAQYSLSWRGAVLADAGVYLFAACLIIGILFKHKSEVALKGDYLKDILLFSGPLAFHLVGRGIMTMSDKIYITNILGIAETGVYAVGYQIGMVIFVLGSSFQLAWMPIVYERLKQNSAADKRIIVRQAYWFLAALLVASILLGLAAPLIIGILVGEKFQGSAVFVPWIAIGFAFNGVYLVFSNFITYAKKTHYLALVTGIGAVTNLTLNYYLILSNGAIGAAQATLITFVVIAIMTVFFAHRCVKMPWLDKY